MNTLDVLNVGTPVSLIWYENGEPQSIIATVCHDDPLTVEAGESVGGRVGKDSQCKVLFQREGSFETANAIISGVSSFGNRIRFELDQVDWVKSDRRNHARYPATLLAKCRYVSEEPSGVQIREFTVTTKDVSMGGAWVMADAATKAGTILNCELSTEPGVTVRVLGVVAWSDPNGRGFGIEFLDFIGASRTSLNQFITKMAA